MLALNRACSQYFLASHKNQRSTTWKDIRRFIVSSKKPQPSPSHPADQDSRWANTLNDFFAAVGPGVADTLAQADCGETMQPRPPRVVSGALSLRAATLPELSAALQSMGKSRACGSDGITVAMLKSTFPVIGPHLLRVINSSITKSEVPLQWKSATVIPLYKKGDRGDPNNYRPISILPVVAKLCERIVCSQLTEYLSTHNILCPQQYGFRPGLSTEAALLDAVTYATSNIDKGHVTSLITVDTSKAFDSVEHGRLLERLGWYGIDTRWFAAWLRDRTQCIQGGTNVLNVSHGVVQGSILGPTLFLVFTTDLVEHLPCGKVIMYADDTQFLDADLPVNISDLKRRVEDTLAVAGKWFVKSRLKINPSKTEMLLIHSRRLQNISFSVSFDNSEIKPSNSVQILGVIFDSGLTWEPHVSAVVRRCYGILIGLARIRNRLPRETKRLLIEALVFPHVRYCLSVWGSCTATQRRRVQKALNFGARIVMGTKRHEHITPVLRELGWHRIDALITERDLTTVRNVLYNPDASEILRGLLVRRSEVSTRRTRSTLSDHLELPRVRSEFARRSFHFRAAQGWNSLPECVRLSAAASMSSFKTTLTSHLPL